MEHFGTWSVLMANFLFVLYVALNGVTLAAVLHLTNGKWRFAVRNIAVSTASLLPLVFILLVVILANGESTFVWMAKDAHDASGGHGAGHELPGWLNYNFLVARQIVGFFIMAGLYTLFIKYQHESDIDPSYAAQRRFRNIALLIPFFYVCYGTMIAWDFEMTQVAGWHSASYGFYHFQSAFHMFLAFFTILLFFLNRSGSLKKPIEPYIFNYLAQYMLAMTILWTYLYFTQYLIMWYGRLPEEMSRFDAMMTGYAPMWWLFLALKFVIPFVTLAITPNRHNPPVVVFVALSIVTGYWLERYTWLSGSVMDHQYFHYPMTSVVDIGITAVIFGVAWFIVRATMRKYGIIKI